MATSPEAYVDTSAFIAFLDASETWHSLFRRLFADPPRLATTPLVVAEGHGWFLRRYDRTRALEYLSFVDVLEPLRVVDVTAKRHEQAVRMLRRFSDQDLTLADALGLAVMVERKTKHCWSTDPRLGHTGAALAIHVR